MPSRAAWRFWTGNSSSGAADYYRKLHAEWREEEKKLQALQPVKEEEAQTLGEKFGFPFVGIRRNYEPGVQRLRRSPKGWVEPPKRRFIFTFQSAPDGMVRRRVYARLGPLPGGISFFGTLHGGWRISVDAEGAEKKLVALRAQIDERAEKAAEAAREKADERRRVREERAQHRQKAVEDTMNPPQVEEELPPLEEDASDQEILARLKKWTGK